MKKKERSLRNILFLIAVIFPNPLWANDISYDFYGILKATSFYSSKPLNSFSYVNSSAPTGAATDQGQPVSFKNSGTWSQQVAQSRAGVNVSEDKLLGNFEIDFINFAVSSPTTESHPRLRRAFVKYSISESHSLQMGQDWDTFSPARPTTLDYVGLYFNAGNVGFMRQQVKWLYHSKSFSSELSLGLPGKNPSTEYNGLETDSSPALAYAFGFADFSFSALYASIQPTGFMRTDVFGAEISFNPNLTDSLKLSVSLYTGQNLNNAGILGISHTLQNKDLQELGGLVNLSYSAGSWGAWTLGYGRAELSNPENSGTYNFDTTSLKIVENGILKNEVIRAFNKISLTKKLSVASELSYFKTTRNLTNTFEQTNEALSLESGFLYVF